MPAFIVNGVQARPLDASAGIFSGAWANAAPLAQTARAAPARIRANCVRRVGGLQTDFNVKNTNICTPSAGWTGQAGPRPSIAGKYASFPIPSSQTHLVPGR